MADGFDIGDPFVRQCREGQKRRDRELKTAEARLEWRQERSICKISSAPPLRQVTAATSRISTISTSISGAGRCGRFSSTKPQRGRASSASSARRAIFKATPLVECASTCAAFAMRYGYSTSVVRDEGAPGRQRFRDTNACRHRRGLSVERGQHGQARQSTHYTRIRGKKAEKLHTQQDQGLETMEWRECPDDWQAPFRPAGEGEYFTLAVAD